MGGLMTIKEVENELEIPRATVRFYEKNGLIHPNRGENAYRTYSESDITELRRIIILRKLGISIEDISNLLEGNIDFGDVLAYNLEKLDEQLRELNGAINMCKKLQEEGTCIEDLSNVTYWDSMEEAEKKGNVFVSIAEDLYVVGKHTFLSQFYIEDCEGNASTDTKGIIKSVILKCLFFGVFFCVWDAIIEKKNLFSFESFKNGVLWPLILVVICFFVDLPFYFIAKKHPVMSKRLKNGFYVSILTMIAILFLLVCIGNV